MRIVHNGVPQSVRGQKRKELLACLLEARIAGRAEVTQLELFDSLYPDEPEDAAAGSLKQLVFQLRKSLGAGVILRTAGGYALGSMGSDAEDFLKNGDTRLWRGVYREDAGPGDETVASALTHALRIKAAALLGADPLEAARLGRLLLGTDPYDIEALRLALKALQASGDQRALTWLYHQGCQQLAEVGERLPERWADFLAQAAA
jgi:DNA-binding SARP family transcriptional activator